MRQHRKSIRQHWKWSLVAASMTVLLAAAVEANEWNERTVLNFSEPVMIPGATLTPGEYVFRLMDSSSNRHIVQVLAKDGYDAVATAQAVPLKRVDPTSDIVLLFNPTDQGAPPAVKGWFYPGSIYGHEFVYPENQAWQIAQRTKRVVLGVDVPGTDLSKGTLQTYYPSWTSARWEGDSATLREWDAWRHRQSRAARPSTERDEPSGTTARMVEGEFQAMRFDLDALEDRPHEYIGWNISVDAEVEEVFGPRLFTIDEPHWGDLDGEMLVFAPSHLAALVRENDQVTVTGTVKPFAGAELLNEPGWLGLGPGEMLDREEKPVLVASRIVGGNNESVLLIDAEGSRALTAGPRVDTHEATLTDAALVTAGNEDLVGRRIELEAVRVSDLWAHGGFYVTAEGDSIFVLPAAPSEAVVKGGEQVDIEGVILDAPEDLALRGDAPHDANTEIYILATDVRSG